MTRLSMHEQMDAIRTPESLTDEDLEKLGHLYGRNLVHCDDNQGPKMLGLVLIGTCFAIAGAVLAWVL